MLWVCPALQIAPEQSELLLELLVGSAGMTGTSCSSVPIGVGKGQREGGTDTSRRW